MVGSGLMEGNIFALVMANPHNSFGHDVISVGLTQVRAIVDLFQSAKPIDTKTFPHVMDALYPVKDYVQVAANLNKFFAAALNGQTFTAVNATATQLALGDILFTCSALVTSSVIAKFAASRNSYLYLFNHTPSNAALSLLGPTHTSEMPFLFGTFDAYAAEITHGASPEWTPTAMEQTMSQSIMDYWLNFARYLDPNGATNGANAKSNAVKWPAAGCGAENNFMVFGDKGPGACCGGWC